MKHRRTEAKPRTVDAFLLPFKILLAPLVLMGGGS
jgi:hypothetical protein